MATKSMIAIGETTYFALARLSTFAPDFNFPQKNN